MNINMFNREWIKWTVTDKKLIKKFSTLDESEIIEKNIGDIAKEFGVVQSTITKFLYKCGYSGWKHFKIIITLSLNSKKDEEQKKKSKISIYAKSFAKFLIDNSELNIFIFGQGDTHIFSMMIVNNLKKLGFVAFSYDINDDTHSYLKGKNIRIYHSVSGTGKSINKYQKESSNGLAKIAIISVYRRIINKNVRYNYKLSDKPLKLDMSGFLYGISLMSEFWALVMKEISKNKIISRTNLFYFDQNNK